MHGTTQDIRGDRGVNCAAAVLQAYFAMLAEGRARSHVWRLALFLTRKELGVLEVNFGNFAFVLLGSVLGPHRLNPLRRSLWSRGAYTSLKISMRQRVCHFVRLGANLGAHV